MSDIDLLLITLGSGLVGFFSSLVFVLPVYAGHLIKKSTYGC